MFRKIISSIMKMQWTSKDFFSSKQNKAKSTLWEIHKRLFRDLMWSQKKALSSMESKKREKLALESIVSKENSDVFLFRRSKDDVFWCCRCFVFVCLLFEFYWRGAFIKKIQSIRLGKIQTCGECTLQSKIP